MRLKVWFVLVFASLGYAKPSLMDSLRGSQGVPVGEDALLTCVVRNLQPNTLVWRRQERNPSTGTVLTAGENRVVADPRISVIHDDGGDVWVLAIKKVTQADAGVYICEVNSNPVIRSLHVLNVTNEDSASSFLKAKMTHNYTDCCKQLNVSSTCLDFCSLSSIMDGSITVDPDQCDSDFPNIIKCMADGRNHVPCCQNQGVPDICQDICRGEYLIPSDDIRTHVSCSSYTDQTLTCIAEGIEILPSSPADVLVESLTEKTLRVSWSNPLRMFDTIQYYNVHVKGLSSFDSSEEMEGINKTDKSVSNMVIKVMAGMNSTVIDYLDPSVMYEISVTSHNIYGESLESMKVRTLTSLVQVGSKNGTGAPDLPDVKECCRQKGIYHNRCVDKFCDPVRTADVSLPDLMVCAPWASDSFSCLANGIDHSPCCRARGLPPACIPLCSGNITRVDFSQFRCIQYMDELSNCLLQGYGVLPSPPITLRVSDINPSFALLRWGTPKTLGDTVTSYNVHYRRRTEEEYRMINTKRVPFILEDLVPASGYEVYVNAVNQYGIGEPSVRLLFRTADDPTDSATTSDYNITNCCQAVNVSSHCMPLCDYSAKMSDLKLLTVLCESEFPKLLRCGAAGRDHRDCCTRRGIPDPCLALCTGSVTSELLTTAPVCVPYLGNVIQCFEEGTGLIPGPVLQLRATWVTNGTVGLAWETPSEGNVTQYIVHYSQLDPKSSKRTQFELDQQMNVTQLVAVVSNLTVGSLYSFFVLAANEHGTSLPSSIITVNATEGVHMQPVTGVPSPPNEVFVSSSGVDYMIVAWSHPILMHPTDVLTYNFYYRRMDEPNFTVKNTKHLNYNLSNLTATSQYIGYVTAVNENGESLPSETLMAWTDPAFPPVVEQPIVHPAGIILEGSSMTVMCHALAAPMPTISMYVGGVLVDKRQTRQLISIVSNVTRSMNSVSCQAENGYGDPHQSSRRLLIGRRPNVTTTLFNVAIVGEYATLQCDGDAFPPPKMFVSRDVNGLEPITNSTKYQVQMFTVGDKKQAARYRLQLTINDMQSSDSGIYFCNAQNSFGSISQAMKLQSRQKKSTTPSTDVIACCTEQNVTSTCMDACTAFLDMDSVIDRPECIGDFHKLMRCAADGSDHRACCNRWGVPIRCLGWCRGTTVPNSEVCALSYTKPIISCFHEGQERIPGPPTNIRIETIDQFNLKVVWDPPKKNPDQVELYRVFWRPQGAKQAEKNDTNLNELIIEGLKDDITYELVMKAGNHFGTSILTKPLVFRLLEKTIISSSTLGNSHIGVVVGVVVALIFIGCSVTGGVWYMRKYRVSGIKLSGGVSFDKPTFLRRSNTTTTDTLQIIANDCNEVPEVQETGLSNAAWKQETLQAAPSTEEVPTLREELHLGSNGAGFKRFK